MKKYKIFKKVVKEKIVCICLQSCKKCRRYCEKDEMLYDEFAGLRECFAKNKEVQLRE